MVAKHRVGYKTSIPVTCVGLSCKKEGVYMESCCKMSSVQNCRAVCVYGSRGFISTSVEESYVKITHSI